MAEIHSLPLDPTCSMALTRAEKEFLVENNPSVDKLEHDRRGMSKVEEGNCKPNLTLWRIKCFEGLSYPN